MPTHLPLSTLLSQVLVAFTIEFDNDFEHQMPHRTTNYGSTTTDSRSTLWLVSLERLVGEPAAQMSALFKGLEPYPDGWRASIRKPATLPHYPMILHRGGFPDGS